MESQKACNQPEQTVRTLIFHPCIMDTSCSSFGSCESRQNHQIAAFLILYVLINGRDRARNRHSTYSENFPHYRSYISAYESNAPRYDINSRTRGCQWYD